MAAARNIHLASGLLATPNLTFGDRQVMFCVETNSYKSCKKYSLHANSCACGDGANL